MPTLRFLVDESCDYLIVNTLRAAGHDVIAVVDAGERSVDAAVIDRAYAEERILVTEDKDFGWHVFVARNQSPGVVLVRFPASMRSAMAAIGGLDAGCRCNDPGVFCERAFNTFVPMYE